MRVQTNLTPDEVLGEVSRRFGTPASGGGGDPDAADRMDIRESRIMIVDDEPLVVDMLTEFLKGDGYAHVVSTDDPVEAYSLIRSEQPDLLLLDHHMTPVNGLAILSEIRAEGDLCRLPVVVLTAETETAVRLRALELGASDFLNKPVDSAEFLVRVRNILNARAHEEQLRRIEHEKRAAVERELMAADAIQARLYPRSPPLVDGLELAGASWPAGAGCGDYFDFLELTDGSIALVVGDVSGHGMPAALRMVEARAYLHSLAKRETDPGRMLSALNRFMIHEAAYASEGGEQFLTLFLARIDAQRHELVYASAGHAGYVIHDSKPTRKLESTGMPLGIADMHIENADPIVLESGDVVLVATDGIEETTNPAGRLFGAVRLLANVRDNRSRSAGKIVGDLYASVQEFSEGVPQHDDITMIVARVTTSPGDHNAGS